MATIRELYQNAGNPDLSHWKDIQIFSIVEASLLTVGIDPLLYEDRTFTESLRGILKKEKPINWQHALMIIRALTQAICLNDVVCKIAYVDRSNVCEEWEEKIDLLDLTLEHLDSINTHSTKISRKEYQKWLKKYGYLEQPQQKTIIIEAQPTIHKQYETEQNTDMVLLPEPKYTTPLLEIVDAVIEKFWSGFKPDESMVFEKQIEIERWIKEVYPDIANPYIAKAIDRICRHPKAKGGGNKKT